MKEQSETGCIAGPIPINSIVFVGDGECEVGYRLTNLMRVSSSSAVYEAEADGVVDVSNCDCSSGFVYKYFLDSYSSEERIREVEMWLRLSKYTGNRLSLFMPILNVIVDRFGTAVGVLMPRISPGDLFDYQGARTEAELRRLMYQLGAELAVMHDMGLVHGDVKPENCFLSGSRGNEVLVLGDFGLTRAVGEGQRGLIGTIDYRAPEIFEGAWGLGVDVWAFGVTIYAALTNRRPFPADSDTSQRAHFQHMITIRASRFNSRWLSECGASAELVDLLRHVLVRDVCARYTIHQALNHPWFQGNGGAS